MKAVQQSSQSSHSSLFLSFLALLGAIAFLSRLAPLFNQGGRLLRQFPTEDGYLMLTIAHNLALGSGMSTAAGTIPTNGTQPLFTFIEALGFALVGGDKTQGVAIALGIQIGISMVTAGFLFALTYRLLQSQPDRWAIAALTAGIWWASALTVPNTMNCLETGLYTALVVITVYVWHGCETQPDSDRLARWPLKVGLLLGLTTWARIDTVFLIAAIAGWHTLLGLKAPRPQLIKRLIESLVMSSIAVLVISPWLINNKVRFGSFMPISGMAQANKTLGENLVELPSKLFELTTMVLQIPMSLEKSWPVLGFTSLVVLGYIALLVITARRLDHHQRACLYVVTTYGGLLITYYGLFFGAAHFVGRYLFPLSPFTTLFTTSILWFSLSQFERGLPTRRVMPMAGMVMLLVLIGATNLRLYVQGTQHLHFQVVEWVEQHVSPSTWVGAVQTGTLGFFHDRTVNLDGKVNPVALAAKRQQKIPDYVTYQTFDPQGGQINYLADWIGIATWIQKPPLDTHFEVIVADRKQNLAVLRRKGQ